MYMCFVRLAVVFLAASLGFIPAAGAQKYPEKPIGGGDA